MRALENNGGNKPGLLTPLYTSRRAWVVSHIAIEMPSEVLARYDGLIGPANDVGIGRSFFDIWYFAEVYLYFYGEKALWAGKGRMSWLRMRRVGLGK